jgi:hypothetical protein
MLFQRVIAAYCVAALIAGCGGGSSLVPGSSGTGPPTATAAHRGKHGRLAFRIRIPKRKGRHRHGKSAHFISPATQSVTIGISGPTVISITQTLTPSTTGCSSSLANTVCQFSYQLSPGSYTATLTTYDTTNGTGNALSTAQGLAFAITAGETNTISLTLAGVPRSLVVTPLSALSSLNAGQIVDLYGSSAQKFMVQALDADGYTIFGAGSPTFSVQQTSGSLGVTLGQPSSAAPNLFTVAAPSAFSTNTATITVSASYTGQPTNGCAQAGAVCTTAFTADMRELLASNNRSSIDIFRAGEATPFAQITNGVNSRPQSGQNAIAFSAAGDLFVGNCFVGCSNGTSSDTVAMYAPPYMGAPVVISNGVYDPQAVLIDSSGNLWVANCYSCTLGGTDTVVEFSPPFSNASRPVLTMSTNLNDPVALGFDGTGTLWVANCGSCGAGGTDTVTSYVSPYTGSPSHTLTGVNGPVALAFDSSNDVYVANQSAGTVMLFTAPGYQTSGTSGPQTIASVGGTSLSTPAALHTDGSNNLWIADQNAGSSGEVFRCGPPSGNTCSSSLGITNSIAGPTDLAFDAAGNLYAANYNYPGNDITEYTSPGYTAYMMKSTSSNSPFGLAVLP